MTKNYICAQCGNEFWPYASTKQQFCSKMCREEAAKSAQTIKRLETAAAKLAAKISTPVANAVDHSDSHGGDV